MLRSQSVVRGLKPNLVTHGEAAKKQAARALARPQRCAANGARSSLGRGGHRARIEHQRGTAVRAEGAANGLEKWLDASGLARVPPRMLFDKPFLDKHGSRPGPDPGAVRARERGPDRISVREAEQVADASLRWAQEYALYVDPSGGFGGVPGCGGGAESTLFSTGGVAGSAPFAGGIGDRRIPLSTLRINFTKAIAASGSNSVPARSSR